MSKRINEGVWKHSFREGRREVFCNCRAMGKKKEPPKSGEGEKKEAPSPLKRGFSLALTRLRRGKGKDQFPAPARSQGKLVGISSIMRGVDYRRRGNNPSTARSGRTENPGRGDLSYPGNREAGPLVSVVSNRGTFHCLSASLKKEKALWGKNKTTAGKNFSCFVDLQGESVPLSVPGGWPAAVLPGTCSLLIFSIEQRLLRKWDQQDTSPRKEGKKETYPLSGRGGNSVFVKGITRKKTNDNWPERREKEEGRALPWKASSFFLGGQILREKKSRPRPLKGKKGGGRRILWPKEMLLDITKKDGSALSEKESCSRFGGRHLYWRG